MRGHTADDVQTALARHGINVSVTAASAARLDLDPRGIDQLVRASVHYYNTDEELDRLVSGVAALA